MGIGRGKSGFDSTKKSSSLLLPRDNLQTRPVGEHRGRVQNRFSGIIYIGASISHHVSLGGSRKPDHRSPHLTVHQRDVVGYEEAAEGPVRSLEERVSRGVVNDKNAGAV